MFGLFKRKRPHVYSQWITPLLEFSSDTAKFYQSIEEGLKAWEVPELVTERIIYKDGSFLSAGREYLRVRREGLIFDILSARFGARWWWFSCRSAVLVRSLRVWELLVFAFGVTAFAAAYIHTFGQFVGSVALGSTLLMLLAMMVAARSWNGLDDLLLRLPVIGAFYEALFRAESYYRDDSRRMYVCVVNHLVREKVREFAAAGGIENVDFHEVSDIQQIATFTDRMKSLTEKAVEVAAKAGQEGVKKLLS
ncbi:MAG: hypothetical protein JNG86_14515 [Verrucomicrobiaceae bacterium]|nr:hypothetical protein [Verrucomicrobiaceae bacterium]